MSARHDLFAPDARKNPFPMYAEMRRESPVCRAEPGGLWAVSRHEDALFVLKHPELFSSQGFRVLTLADWLPRNPLAESIVLMDPPVHTKMRALVSRAFTPTTIVRLLPRITAIAEELAADLARRGEADFVADFAVPLPSRVICELLGLDPSLHAEFNRWNRLMQMISPVTPPEHIPEIQKCMEDVRAHMLDVIEARRRAPAHDMVSDLLRAEVDGQRLTDDEIIAFMILLLIAGFETTSSLLSKSLVHLSDTPSDVARLRANPRLLPGFIEEALRFCSPAENLFRLTTTDVTLSGVTIPAGSTVCVMLASANRDERKFPDPDRFDMERAAQGVLSFGHGIHYCIGASLAKAEAMAGYEALLARFERFERTTADIPWNTNLAIRNPMALPMRFVRPSLGAPLSARPVSSRRAAAASGCPFHHV